MTNANNKAPLNPELNQILAKDKLIEIYSPEKMVESQDDLQAKLSKDIDNQIRAFKASMTDYIQQQVNQ